MVGAMAGESGFQTIHIRLNSYDEMFSHFDDSPYSERALSDDFLKEIGKRYAETKKGTFEVRCTVPAAGRNPNTESLIKRRLRQYFRFRLDDIEKESRQTRKKGFIRLAAGIFLMFIEFLLSTADMPLRFLSIIAAAGGWYAIFTGFEYTFDEPPEVREKRKFYTRFAECRYIFLSDEEFGHELDIDASPPAVPLLRKPRIIIRQK